MVGKERKITVLIFFVILFMEFAISVTGKKTVIEGSLGQRKSPSEEVTLELRPLKKQSSKDLK